ncbi:MAG: flavin reductase family protein [Candidatus Krumholzibacteriota bacterium]|nr:flavin reductase family protein [Candidatus Krumholzibacteriota bacterium]
MKSDVEYLEFMWPLRHFLITCGQIGRKSNIMAVSFCMPVSKEPPLIACAIAKEAYSCELIKETGEFIVNVPPPELEPRIYYCGFHSGRDVDKFAETGLTPRPARRVKVPFIDECLAHMECRVKQAMETGDKMLFVGEVVEAYADEDLARGERNVEFTPGGFPRKIYATRFKER